VSLKTASMYGYKGCPKNSAVVYFCFSRLHSIAVDNRVTVPVVHVRVFNQVLCFIALPRAQSLVYNYTTVTR